MGLMELYGLGWNDFQKYPAAIGKVSFADVRRVAEKYFLSGKPVEIVVGPASK